MPLKCHLITKEARARHGIQALLSRDSRNFVPRSWANLAVGVQLLAEAVKLSETRLIWGNHGLPGCDLVRLLNRYYIGDCSASSSQRDRPTLKAWNEIFFCITDIINIVITMFYRRSSKFNHSFPFWLAPSRPRVATTLEWVTRLAKHVKTLAPISLHGVLVLVPPEVE